MPTDFMARQYGEHEGTFGDDGKVVPDIQCRKCACKGTVSMRVWESSDGAFEDYKFKCAACGHVWWVDGIDS